MPGEISVDSPIKFHFREYRPERDDLRVALRANATIAVYLLSIASIFLTKGVSAAVVWPLCGLIFYGFLNAAHDCVHGTHFCSKSLNRIMGSVWCTPILVNYTVYKYQHLRHHKFTGTKGDTETHSFFTTLGSYFFACTGLTSWVATFAMLRDGLCGTFPKSVNSDSRRSSASKDNYIICCWLSFILWMTWLYPRQVLIAYWMPLIFYFSVGFILSLPEHYGISQTGAVLLRSRNVKSNALVRFFLWNANYHAIHHAFPSIPASRLHKFRVLLEGSDELSEEASYIRFHMRLLKFLCVGKPATTGSWPR